jgi:hypothetical protein
MAATIRPWLLRSPGGRGLRSPWSVGAFIGTVLCFGALGRFVVNVALLMMMAQRTSDTGLREVCLVRAMFSLETLLDSA